MFVFNLALGEQKHFHQSVHMETGALKKCFLVSFLPVQSLYMIHCSLALPSEPGKGLWNNFIASCVWWITFIRPQAESEKECYNWSSTLDAFNSTFERLRWQGSRLCCQSQKVRATSLFALRVWTQYPQRADQCCFYRVCNGAFIFHLDMGLHRCIWHIISLDPARWQALNLVGLICLVFSPLLCLLTEILTPLCESKQAQFLSEAHNLF